jgi:PEP-CTERM motif
MNVVALRRMIRTLCGLSALLVVVIGTSGVAHAVAGALSSASVTVNPFADPLATVNLSTTDAIATSASSLNFTINSALRTAWEDAQVQASTADSPYSNATGTADSTGATISQLSLALANGSGAYSANAQTLHDVDFTVTGNVTLTVTAVYDLFMQVYKDYAHETATGYLLAGVYLRNLTQLTESSDVVELNYLPASNPNPLSQTGTLSTILAFAAGDAGTFRVIVDGNATTESVPEPSTFALLGLGLAGAALLKRRNRHC